MFQAIFSKPEGDVTLDSPDEELVKSFREFYDDTLPEFRKIGDVKMFKVCSNRVQHLRGNVYVEYEREEEAFVAAQVNDDESPGYISPLFIKLLHKKLNSSDV